MSRALPPLPALRAFEAAARHANFARAAAELNVTPGALSHQIRALESHLGVRLFERQARGVALTASGRALYPGLLAGFALVREAVESLRALTRSAVIVVSTPPGFTAKWLAPRLYRFAEAHPEVELRIASSAAYANFASDGVDIAVRNIPDLQAGDGALESERLIAHRLVAVCTPQRLAEATSSSGAGLDLRRLPLIHDDQLAGRPEVPTWSDWFRAAGLEPVDTRRGLRFSSAEHAIEAAKQGAGLLLTHELLAHDDLASGGLVRATETVLDSGRAYYLVRPRAAGARAGVDVFRAWLKAEMAATAAAKA